MLLTKWLQSCFLLLNELKDSRSSTKISTSECPLLVMFWIKCLLHSTLNKELKQMNACIFICILFFFCSNYPAIQGTVYSMWKHWNKIFNSHKVNFKQCQTKCSHWLPGDQCPDSKKTKEKSWCDVGPKHCWTGTHKDDGGLSCSHRLTTLDVNCKFLNVYSPCLNNFRSGWSQSLIFWRKFKI